jgi:hypothetical protein
MKKLLIALAASFVLALGSCSIAATSTEAAQLLAQPKSQSNTKATFMFMFSANKGSLTRSSSNKYTLNIKKSELNKIVIYSERPYKTTKIISGKDLSLFWKDGAANSFKRNPPNGTLAAGEQKQVVVKITNMRSKGGLVSFSLTTANNKNMAKLGHTLNDITLVIDSTPCVTLLEEAAFIPILLPLYFARCKH